MWDLLEEGYNDDVPIDRAASLYCGDLAGRTGARKDGGDTDRKLALNVGVAFHTPEELFLGGPRPGTPAPYALRGLDPHAIGQGIGLAEPLTAAPGQEMLLMVGAPGSGKTTHSRRLETEGYARVNMDELQTAARCVAEATRALARGQSVVIDNTNPDRAARARYIAVARKAGPGVRVRCAVHTASKDVCFHNNTYRGAFQGAPVVPAIAIHSYFKRYEPPSPAEGIDEAWCCMAAPH
jgi:bifunctional polynucleotide phosphatase/kinase